MARIVQRDLFGWKSVKLMPALERFTMVRDTLDDEDLVSELERQRGKGRDDYCLATPIGWNPTGRFCESLLATNHAASCISLSSFSFAPRAQPCQRGSWTVLPSA